MAHELEVRLFADRVGTLALVDGRLSFCFAPGWLSQPGAVALSNLKKSGIVLTPRVGETVRLE